MTDEERQLLADGANFRISRPTIEKMDEELIANVNEMVGEEDQLWLLGDLLFSPEKHYFGNAYEYLGRIKCKNVHVVWGNHDHCRTLAPLFKTCHDQVLLAIADDGEFWVGQDEVSANRRARHSQKIMLNHYMMAIWHSSHKGTWHLYGHSHSGAEPWAEKHLPGRRSVDVGVDNANKVLGAYRPFSFEELGEMFASRTGCFFDHHR